MKKKIQKIEKMFQMYREGELFEIAKLCGNYLPNKLITLNKTYFLVIDKDEIKLRRKPKNYKFRRANLSDLPNILSCSNHSQSDNIKEIFERYFTEKHICYVIEYNDEIIAYIWAFQDACILSYDDYDKINIRFKYGKNAVFFGDGFIKPIFRLRGFFPILINDMIGDLSKNNNKSIFWAMVSAFNKHSLKSHMRLGFSVVKQCYYISILNNQFIIISDKKKSKIYSVNNYTSINL